MRITNIIFSIMVLNIFSGCMGSQGIIEIAEEDCNSPVERGVVISFDDSQNIESWGQNQEFLKSHGVIVTFFIDRWHKLEPWELDILENLSDDGHEIGFHATNHGDYFEFLEQNLTEKDYLEIEIIPGLNHMDERGYNATSFAYPRGHRDTNLDVLLLEYFSVLRGTQSNKDGSESWVAECEDLRVFRSFPLITTEETEESLEYREKWTEFGFDSIETGNKTLLFNGHGIVNGQYATSLENLELLFSEIEKNNLKYLLMSDLGR